MILLHLPGPDSVGGHEDVIMYGPPYTTTSMSVLVVGLKTDQNLASVWTSSMTPPQGMSEKLTSTNSFTILNLMANPTPMASCEFDAHSAYSHPWFHTLCCADVMGLPVLWDKQLITLQLLVICNMLEQHSQTGSYLSVSVHHPVPWCGCIEHMAQDLHINSHTGTMQRVHSAFIFEFPIGTHKFDDMLELWDSTLKRGNIPMSETRFQ